jgi:hypothetical protein
MGRFIDRRSSENRVFDSFHSVAAQGVSVFGPCTRSRQGHTRANSGAALWLRLDLIWHFRLQQVDQFQAVFRGVSVLGLWEGPGYRWFLVEAPTARRNLTISGGVVAIDLDHSLNIGGGWCSSAM